MSSVQLDMLSLPPVGVGDSRELRYAVLHVLKMTSVIPKVRFSVLAHVLGRHDIAARADGSAWVPDVGVQAHRWGRGLPRCGVSQ